MAEFDVFLSYASADLTAAKALEAWMQSPPRNRRVWRDRRGILPGAPDYYVPIARGIAGSAAFLVLLSPHWLRSKVAARELSDALAAGKKLIVIVHPAIARDPATPEGRQSKSELTEAVEVSGLAAVLERPNRIWPREVESAEPDFAAVERALATDFAWATRHAVIVERLNRWKELRDPSALLRGGELSELLADAFADAPGREPHLTGEERTFLLESQSMETAERERVEGLYWGAQARAAAFAARERGEAEPDLALLLGVEAISVAPVPEARAALLSVLHRHARLTAVLRGHEPNRWISGVAFSPDGRWLASGDRPQGIGDDRRAHVLIYETNTGEEWQRIPSGPISAMAWGQGWLAVASKGFIGWLRWDAFYKKFRGNTPVELQGNAFPDYLAFSPPEAAVPQTEILAWGTQWGDIGLILVGDHASWQGRLGEDRSSKALAGLGWLSDGRLITAENDRVLIRPFPDLQPVQEVARMDHIGSLVCDGRMWIADCVSGGETGLLFGQGAEPPTFHAAEVFGTSLTTAWCGPRENRILITASATHRSGVPVVEFSQGESPAEVLLQGEDQLVRTIAGDSSGRFVAAGDMQGRLWLWDLARRSHIVSQLQPGATVACIAVSPSGPAVLVEQGGRILCFAGGLSAAHTAEAVMAPAPIHLQSAHSGQLFVALAADGAVSTLDVTGAIHHLEGLPELQRPVRIAAAAEAPIIAVLEPGHQIAVGRISETTFVPVCTIDAGRGVVALALDPAGNRLFAVCEGLGLEVVSWPVSSAPGAATELFGMRHVGIPQVAFTVGEAIYIAADGMYVVLGPVDQSGPAVWLGGHDEPVKRVATAAHLIASAACSFQDTSVDRILLWTDEGRFLGEAPLPEHAADIAVLPSTGAVVALGQSGALWHLALSADALTAAARRIAGRGMTPEERRQYGIETWKTGGAAASPSPSHTI